MTSEFDGLFAPAAPAKTNAAPTTAVAAPSKQADSEFSDLFGSVAPAAATAPRATSNPEQFVSQYLPLAQSVAAKIGVSPQALLGQWGMETGWGKSVIPGTNNLGNIKDFSGRGPVAIDNMTKSSDSYRRFDTAEDFGEHFAGLINRRYGSAVNAGEDTQKFFTGLKRGGYAEDPAYIQKGVDATNRVSAIMGKDPQALQTVRGAQAASPNGYVDNTSDAPLRPRKTLAETAVAGFKGGFTSSQGLSAQVGALILNSVGVAPELQQTLLEYGEGKRREVADSTGDASSFTDAIGEGGDLKGWVANSAGYLAYQVAESILTGGLGAIAAKTVGKGAVTGMAKGLMEREITQIASTEAAKALTKDQMSALAASKVASKLGAATAIFGNNMRQQGGSIYGDAVEEAGKTGAEVDVGRVWLSALASAGIDTAADLAMAKGLLGMKEGSTAASYAGRLARELPKNIGIQGGTEAAQTVIEQFGAKKEIGTAESWKDVIDSAAVGALGGTAGAVGVAMRKRDAVVAPLADQIAADPANSALKRAALAGNTGAAADAELQDQVTQTAAQAAQAAPAPPAADPLAERTSNILGLSQGGALLPALRNPESPVSVKEFIKDLATVRSPSARADIREMALARLETASEWAQLNPAPIIAPTTEQIVGAPTTSSADVDATTPLQRQAGIDRDADLQAELANAPTEFDREQVRAQMRANAEARLGLTPAEQKAPESQPKSQGLSPAEQKRLDVAAQAGAAPGRTNSPAANAAIQRINERGGVASQEEADTLTAAGYGKPYDRIDPALKTGAKEFATKPRSTTRFDNGAAQAERQTELDAQNAAGSRKIGQRPAAPEQAPAAAPAGPTSARVTAILRTPAFQRSATDKATLARAGQSFSTEQMALLQRTSGTAPATHSTEDRLALRTLQEQETVRDDAITPSAVRSGDGTITQAVKAAGAPVDVAAPNVPATPGEGTAVFRKRRATLSAIAESGLTTVERRNDGNFFMVDGTRKRQYKLSGPADAALARKAIKDLIDGKANAAATSPKNDRKEPSPDQIDSVNWKKGDRFQLNGQTLVIENPAGSVRKSKPGAKQAWETKMAGHYGDMAGTKGADGDPVDVFVGRDPSNGKIFVIDQANADGSFDEHKVMMGYVDADAARAGYLANYEKGWTGLAALTEVTPAELGTWLKSGNTNKPLGDISGATRRTTAEVSEGGSEGSGADVSGGVADGRTGRSVQSDQSGAADAGVSDISDVEAGAVLPDSTVTGYVTINDGGTTRKIELVAPLGEAASGRRPGRAHRITKPQAETLRALAAFFGKQVEFFRDPRLADGFVKNGDPVIYLNESASIHPMSTLFHELSHLIRRDMPEVHAALMKVVEASLDKDAAAKFRNNYNSVTNSTNESLNDGELEEITSDLGGTLMSDPKFWEQVFAQIQKDNPQSYKTMLAQLINFLNGMINDLAKAIGQKGFMATELVKDMDAVRDAYRDALAKFAKENGITQAAMGAEVAKAGQEIKRSRDRSAKDIHESFFPPKRLTSIAKDAKEVFHAIKKMSYGKRQAFQVDHGIKLTGDWSKDFANVATAIAQSAGISGYSDLPQVRVFGDFGDSAYPVKAGQGFIQVMPDVSDTDGVRTLYINFVSQATTDEVIAAATRAASYHGLTRIFYGPDSGMRSIGTEGAISRDPSRSFAARARVLSMSSRSTSPEESAQFAQGMAAAVLSKQDSSFVVGRFVDIEPVRKLGSASSDITKSTARAYNPEDDGALPADQNNAPGRLGRGADAAAGAVPEYGTARAGAVSVLGRHFSTSTRRSLSGSAFGTGLKGAERARLTSDADPRLMKRIAFYIDTGKGIRPESGVGAYAHEVRLNNIYDPSTKLVKWKGGPNNFESAVIDAGFDGYMIPDHNTTNGAAVLLGKAASNVPVKPIGQAGSAPAPVDAEPTSKSKGLMSRELSEVNAESIPGAKIKGGTLTVPMDSYEAANTEMARIGSPVRFSPARADDSPAAQYAKVQSQYKGTDQWLKAPNGKATKLTKRQWVHVRTPAFKSWFGDWEAFAGKQGGVWSDDGKQVSKAVDDNGEPLVVYHGSDDAGFMEFEKPGGARRGDLGIFTSDAWSTAASYITRGRANKVEEPEPPDVRRGEDGFYFDDSDGYESGPFDTRAEAERVAREDADTDGDSNKEPGVYALFINTRNPMEADFEGANWSGEALDQYQVMLTTEEDPYTTPDGKRNFDKDEADRLAAEMDGDVVPAMGPGQSTDDVVREARQYKNDGAIVRTVVDDGSGASGMGDPSNVFVVFDPNQVKSADFNGGEYSLKDDDIRMSPDRGNIHGFVPELRAPVKGKLTLPDKPLFTQATTNKNAGKQISGINKVLEKFPSPENSPEDWTRMMGYALASRDVPIPPYQLIKRINSGGYGRLLRDLTPGQVSDADHGFENAAEFRKMYEDGTADVVVTGKLALWSFLSRGVSPYVQESLFLDAVTGIDPWVKLAAEGKFDQKALEGYAKWADTIAGAGSGRPGSGAKHNLNAFGNNYLINMAKEHRPGKTRLQHWHDLVADFNNTGPELRRAFTLFGEGVGIDNKVVSFSLLVSGRNDILVMDRVQIKGLWDDGRFAGRNLYDGSNDAEGNAITGSKLSDLFSGARGLLIYEAAERAISKHLAEYYEQAGRPEAASLGRFHWETWVTYSGQEASHGTIQGLMRDAAGQAGPYQGITAKQGEYGEYAYGTRYGIDPAGVPYFLYDSSAGESYRFTIPAFREMLEKVKKSGNKVRPSKFLVSKDENGNDRKSPWFNDPRVDRAKLDEFIKQHGRLQPGERAVSPDDSESTANVARSAGRDGTGGNADARAQPATGRADAQPVPQPGGVRGGDGVLAGTRRPYQGDGRQGTSLEGLPTRVTVDGKPTIFAGFKPAQDAAADYAAEAGLAYSPPTTYAKVDAERATRIAQAFDELKHEPGNPEVKAAYDAMIQETLDQYQAILKTGLKVEFNDGADPYGNPRNAILDVVENNHLYVFSTKDGFGSSEMDVADNPLLAPTEFMFGDKPALANDIFRVVHDYFGHIKEGVGFRADGEENAWRSHSAMYSPLARRAMTTETRGQNSWVNYGPKGEFNRNASGGDTIYADQKVGLLPDWVASEDSADAPGGSSVVKTPTKSSDRNKNQPARPEELIALRKRKSVLESIQKCLGKS